MQSHKGQSAGVGGICGVGRVGDFKPEMGEQQLLEGRRCGKSSHSLQRDGCYLSWWQKMPVLTGR